MYMEKHVCSTLAMELTERKNNSTQISHSTTRTTCTVYTCEVYFLQVLTLSWLILLRPWPGHSSGSFQSLSTPTDYAAPVHTNMLPNTL